MNYRHAFLVTLGALLVGGAGFMQVLSGL